MFGLFQRTFSTLFDVFLLVHGINLDDNHNLTTPTQHVMVGITRSKVIFFTPEIFASLRSHGTPQNNLKMKILSAERKVRSPKRYFFWVTPYIPWCFCSDPTKKLGGGNSNIFYVHPYLGKIRSNLRSIIFKGVGSTTK